VVFQVFKDGVWLVDLATREMRRIDDDPTAEEFAWAPDGRRIAYHSRRDGAWKIWVTQVGGNAN
jgi:Tol biopolymer transport system component